MRRAIILSLSALSIVLSTGACRAAALRSKQPPRAGQTTGTPDVSLATLRRDFKDSLPVPIGEKLEYEVKLSRFPLYISLGVVTFDYLGITDGKMAGETRPDGVRAEPPIKGLNVEFTPPGDRFLHLRATAVSKGLFIAIFGGDLKYRYETLTDPNDLSAHLDVTEIQQGKDHTMQSIVYDRQQGQIKYLLTNLAKPEAPPRTKSLPYQDGIMGLLSAFYFVRFQKFKTGQMLRFPVSAKETNHQFEILVGHHQTIKTACGKIKAIRLEPKLFGPNQLFTKKGEMTMWVTDNSRHVPLQVVAKTGATTITAKLTNYNQRRKNCQLSDPETGEPQPASK